MVGTDRRRRSRHPGGSLDGWRVGADWAAMAGVVVMAAALWLPWFRSGERLRNAFELAITIDRLDVAGSVIDGLWRWLGPLVPVAAAAAWVALMLGNRRLFLASVAAVGVIVGVPATVGVVAFHVVEPGVLAALAGLLVLVASLASVPLGRSTTDTLEPEPRDKAGGRAHGR